MKTQLNNKSGFTLIEIIVVLIIVGILAAIALPNLFSNVAKSKSAEALTLAEAFRNQFEACVQANYTAACEPTFQTGGNGAASTVGNIADPGNSNVTFSIPTLVPSPSNAIAYTIQASSASDNVSSIQMVRSTNGTVVCSGTGAWTGVC